MDSLFQAGLGRGMGVFRKLTPRSFKTLPPKAPQKLLALPPAESHGISSSVSYKPLQLSETARAALPNLALPKRVYPEFGFAEGVLEKLNHPRLGSLAGKLTPDDIVVLSHNPNAKFLFDRVNGTINIIQPLNEILFRATCLIDEFKFISVGRVRKNQLDNSIKNKKYIPLGSEVINLGGSQ